MDSRPDNGVETKRGVLGQVVLCLGCCCGQSEKGRAPVPEARIKSVWKAEKLNRTIQLTISGCVGPCDVANVVQIVTPNRTIWFGRLNHDTHYDVLIEWARTCHSAKGLVPVPAILTALQFEGYITG